MKKLLVLFVFFGLMACSDDDNNSNNANTFNGSWNMDSYLAFTETLPELSEGDITWTINGSSITVVNSVESEYPYILPSGNYTLAVNGTIVRIGNNDYHYSFQGNKMTLTSTEHEVDGPSMIFTRN